MIQCTQPTAALATFTYNLNLWDEFDNIAEYKPLVTITSQLTGSSKTFLNTLSVFTNKERYIALTAGLLNAAGTENLSVGLLKLGTTDFPLGFYDVTIYENSSNINVDPSGLKVIYTGLMNVTSKSGTESVTYSEYTTNDSDTESVYITI
jgi:hypothetical protein